ncbi:MAG: MBL fold metallo-hydrolase, partial [Gammaproteobacteria bacterium]|nr:MBL fold metallo-hydrolase [Gammaproteobacteria bacterium]NIT64557.1 MBL fold metallo-hydrolase [Gammaproteobacteria bacterium]NIV21486.1 MBL fold metallo-hydrolase [Gammaproteobacteria bacterium]NIY33137.1 MBL fold metallo-hydrolase [Gammaproteobacteria bacterium]
GPENGYVTLDGRRITINAGIHEMSGYSAHADQADLLRFIRRIHSGPREVRIVHGEPEPREVFAAKVRELCPEAEVISAEGR